MGQVKRVTAVCAVLGGAAIAGCGSSSTLSHQELVTQANAVCSRANASVSALTRPTTPQATVNYADRLHGIATDLVNGLSALKPSSSDKATYERYVNHQRDGIKAVEQLKHAAQTQSKQEALAAVQRAQQDADDADATSLGLNECAKVVAPKG